MCEILLPYIKANYVGQKVRYLIWCHNDIFDTCQYVVATIYAQFVEFAQGNLKLLDFLINRLLAGLVDVSIKFPCITGVLILAGNSNFKFQVCQRKIMFCMMRYRADFDRSREYCRCRTTRWKQIRTHYFGCSSFLDRWSRWQHRSTGHERSGQGQFPFPLYTFCRCRMNWLT